MTANADLKAVVRNWIAKRILSTNDDYLASNDYVKFHQIEEESATSGVYSTILKDTDESGQIEFIDTLDASEKNGRIILLDENDQVVPIYNENKGTQLSMRTAQNIMPIYAFCYENGKYVGVGYECCCYSTDGETFTAGTIPEGEYNGIAYGNGKFVAVGTDICAYSTDGITFTAGTIPEGNYRNIIYGNGKFVAIGGDVCAYSSDGETFTTATVPEYSGYHHGITYGDGKFVVVGNNIAYSSDGETFTTATLPESVDFYPDITYGNGKFVAIGIHSDMVYNDELGICATVPKDVIAYSSDGETFTAGTLPENSSYPYITYGNGKFVALSEGGTCAYSTDGETFTAGTIPNCDFISSITYGDGKFVIIADECKILYSTDGITFTRKEEFDICFTNISFINNTFLTSGFREILNDDDSEDYFIFIASLEFNEGDMFSESIDWTAQKEAQMSNLLSSISELSVPIWFSEENKTKFAQYKSAVKYEIDGSAANANPDKKIKIVGFNMFNDAITSLESSITELEARLNILISAFEDDEP